MANDLIGVTGASGEMGGRVARRLAAAGLRQRLIVRNAGRAPQLEGAEVAEMTGYGDGESFRAAVEGVHTLFLVPGEEAPNRVEQHKTAVDGAVAAGVKRIVYLSFVKAAPDATFTLVRHHWATEEHIRTKDVAHCFPRMSMYMDFIPFFADAEGVIRGPAGQGRVGAILRDDLADVVATILRDPAAHDGQIYECTGPEAFTLGEAAEALSRTGDKAISYHEETIEEAWDSRRASTGAEDWEIEGWISSYTAIADGDLDLVTGDVRRLIGRDPLSLEEWLSARAGEPTSP
jgi:NAD(P)H dehydrogenase (quinone)